jgi:hypothetical protein
VTENALRRSRIEADILTENVLRRSRIEADLAVSRRANEEYYRRLRIEEDVDRILARY